MSDDMKRVIFVLLTVMGVGLLASLGLVGSTAVWAQEKVTLQLKWKHQFQFAGYYAAKAKGFYAEEGFDVTIKEYNMDGLVSDHVLSGEADFGIADSSLVLQHMQGKDVVLLTAVFQRSPMIIMTTKESGIKSPYDLIGKKLMYRKNSDDASLTAMFTFLGIRPEQLIHVPHTFQDDALLNGTADAMAAYSTNQPFLYDSLGIPVNIIDPANYGVDFYGDLLFSSKDYVTNNPERAEAFKRASLKGWAYAIENQAEIVRLILTQYNPALNPKKVTKEAEATAQLINMDIIPIGTTFRTRFYRIAQTYVDLGLAKSTYDMQGFLLADYLQTSDNFLTSTQLITLASVLLMVVIIAAGLVVFNRRLQRAVRVKTDQLQREKSKAEDANISKSYFLANMSHEIRTPLNGIYGSLQLLRAKNMDDESSELVAIAEKSSQSLLTILNDVLDISKIEAGKLDIENTAFDLTEVIEEVVRNFTPLAVDNDTNLSFYGRALGVNMRMGDPGRVRQIISNIVSNAVKFTSGGKVTITATGDADTVTLVIADTGIGMTPEFLKKIRQKYLQADASTSRKYGGSGLGLTIVDSLIEMMDGSLQIDSKVGEGSQFTLTLSLPEGEAKPASVDSIAPEQGAVKSSKPTADSGLKGLRILVAEDVAVNQLILDKMLSDTGAIITFANNGIEAIEAVNQAVPDVILMDIQMPEMDGVEATKRLREQYTALPIIALTANAMSAQRQDYINQGFTGFVAKPIEINALVTALLKVLKK